MSEKDSDSFGHPVLKYPRGAFFILAGYLLERFVYYGLFGGVVFYMQRVLEYSAPTSSTIKAIMEGLIYLAPVAGAILSDSYLGKFRTVFTFCCCYTVGAIIFSSSSLTPIMGSVSWRQFAGIGGIAVLGISAGLMKAVYSSLGPDQFIVPEQRMEQERFFYAFYWMINAGAFLGQMLTAQLRDTVQCFGDDCYALPFFILCGIMVISTSIFYAGKKLYRQNPPDLTLLNSCKCLAYASKKAIFNREKPVEHWIDRAADRYNKDIITDVKNTLRILMVFTPMPFFWALFYQTSTGMIFQAKRLNGYIGSYKIPPELTSSVNPLLILILIPLFQLVIYPFLNSKKILTKPRQRMTLGMALGSVSFILYGILNLQVEQDILQAKTAELNIYNVKDCAVVIEAGWIPKPFIMNPYTDLKLSPIHLHDGNLRTNMTFSCDTEKFITEVTFSEKHETTVILFPESPKVLGATLHYLKDVDAEAKVRMTTNHIPQFPNIGDFKLRYKTLIEQYTLTNGSSEFYKISPKSYIVQTGNNTNLGEADIKQDGVYDVVVVGSKSYVFALTVPSNVHVLWLLPQYLVITIGEVLFSVSGMDFSYTEAPLSMKAFMQAANLFTITAGLWMFAIITKITSVTKIYEHRASSEAFSYAVGMAVNTIVFSYLINLYYRKKESQKTPNTTASDNPCFDMNEEKL